MKALSVKQPWAYLIPARIKDIENRNWRTHFRGKVYIHASAKLVDVLFSTEQTAELFVNNICLPGVGFPSEMRITSAIIGEVEIIDCVINHPSIWAEKTPIIGKTIEGEDLYKHKPIWNWVLANPVLYEKPILNVKGKLSFWEPDIDIVECIGCNGKFNYEEMKQDESEENFCTECWEEMSPIMIKETKECNARDKLAEFGKVVTVKQSENDFEFLITDGFSQNATNTFSCMEECYKIAENYPNVKKCVTEDNNFHFILTKDKK